MKQKWKEQYKESIKQRWFFGKINKIDEPIAKLTKRKKEDQKKKKRILYRENKDKHSHDNMGNNKSQ
jgi:hypothetical protein